MNPVRHFFARLPVWAVAVITSVGLVATTSLGVVAIADVQSQSQVALEQSYSALETRIAELLPERDALALAVQNATKLLADSSGKTLDDAARAQLTSSLADAQAALDATNLQISAAQQELDVSLDPQDPGLVFPWDRLAQAQRLAEVTVPSETTVSLVISSVGEKMQGVRSAQDAWQAEQDRIEAERAAAARIAAAKAAQAAAERAAAANQIKTTPTAPVAPSVTAPVVAGFNVEAYIFALAPNAFVTWVTGLCQPGYICGEALVGGFKTTPVQIRLDAGLRTGYSTAIGKSVLVHEAAHARQWYTYVGDIITVSETQSGLVGRPAVEYMADCATIGKYGTSTNAYTSSCTPAQLSAIAGIW